MHLSAKSGQALAWLAWLCATTYQVLTIEEVANAMSVIIIVEASVHVL